MLAGLGCCGNVTHPFYHAYGHIIYQGGEMNGAFKSGTTIWAGAIIDTSIHAYISYVIISGASVANGDKARRVASTSSSENTDLFLKFHQTSST